MFGWDDAVIAGGAALGFLGGQMTNDFNAEEAEKQRRFEEDMYRNRYQYQVEDMKKAGLNPILSATSGAPGPPGGASASGINPLQGVSNTAMDIARFHKIDKPIAEANLQSIKANTAAALSQKNLNDANTHVQNTANHLQKLAIPGVSNASDVEKSSLGKYGAYASKVGNVLGSFLPGAISGVKLLDRFKYGVLR